MNDNFVYQDLVTGPFKIADLLMQEAAGLTKYCPTKAKPKAPSGSKSRKTEMGKEGKGPAHCTVRLWPPDKTPGAWGDRNHFVLLEETINSDIFKELMQMDPEYLHIRRRAQQVVYSLQSSDDGNEVAFRHLVQQLLSRLTAIAFLFFLNQWLKHPNDIGFFNAMKAVLAFDVQQEFCSSATTRHDVAVLIRRISSLPILRTMSSTADTVPLFMANAKSTGQSDYPYSSIQIGTTDVTSVDQTMSAILQETLRSDHGLSIKELNEFLSNQTIKLWPQISTSHLTQVTVILKFFFVMLTLNYEDGV
jgi:hypothetical protein